MNKNVIIFWFIGAIICTGNFPAQAKNDIDDQFTYAQSRSDDLQLSIYITAHAINNLLTTEAGRREAISIFRGNGITKAYLEVYRSGLVINQSVLEKVRDTFLKHDIDVVGGIATVPGGDFGVKQKGKLGWFNWQNPKTQNDLKEVVKMSARVFNKFIIDDFLCTADTSEQSKLAKGDQSWSQYRRDLLTKLSSEIFIKPAKEVNPDIEMIIKYPQWYDRFHLFGYELESQPQLFDRVYVGTETRGQYTQRYGFVQPYEGFINYRWIKDIAANKIGGAWFDHGDCDEKDFIEQAYQSVLAGAREIVIFNYFDFINGHKGHHLLRIQFQQLVDLAKSVAVNPVDGVFGYKPINSDAGGDLYVMDFLGSLGIPLIPVHQYPTDAKVVFLPTQAAADADISSKVKKSLSTGSTIIFTSGFLANASNGKELAKLAGIDYPIEINPLKADMLMVDNKPQIIKNGLYLESKLSITDGKPLLMAISGKSQIPFLVKSNKDTRNVYTLNSHTFSQADFDKVGEVLLCPKPLGLLEIPRIWTNTLRNSFISELNHDLDAPTRIVMQPLGPSGWLLHNYNNTEETIRFSNDKLRNVKLVNGFTGKAIEHKNNSLEIVLKPRSRLWLKVIL